MTCDHHLNDGPLICDRTDEHRDGHTYCATSLPDHHDNETARAA